jgi:hypothetical protein
MMGEVLEDRFIDGIPIAANSVAVCCTHSLGRFPDLDKMKTNVWTLSDSQVLTGQLLEEAKRNPEPFLRKFVEMELKVREQRRAQAAAKVQQQEKRPPGKR